MSNTTTRSLCVFCASSDNVDEKYKKAAYRVGQLCAQHGWELIYGAGAEGLMGAVCDGCQDAGGKVKGIIPQWMVDKGWLRPGVDEVVKVSSMAVRKQLFRELCDAVIVLPGGYGTMEEFFETVTAKQVGHFPKPIIVLNQDGYYDLLEQWKLQCNEMNFASHNSGLDIWTTISSPDELFPHLSRVLNR